MKNNQKGFTLIEMMIVLLVISVLLVITVPNITKHNSTINKKGNDAYEKMVQGQVQAYEMEFDAIPTIQELYDNEYLVESEVPAGKTITISAEGDVTLADSAY